MIELQEGNDGWRLAVRAFPGARRDAIEGERAGRLCVRVTAAPERGRANRAIEALLAKGLGLRRGQVEIVLGRNRADKVVLLRDLSPSQQEAVRRLVGRSGSANSAG